MTLRSKISSVASWVALAVVAALLGLGLLALVHRVETLDGALDESRSDRSTLHSELNEQEAASQALAEQVRRLGGKPVIEPGPAGAAGVAGPRGPEGKAGADGRDGKNGSAGATGATGRAGADGADGAAGPPGSKGDTGPMGPAGADGAPGAPGADGEDGRSVESVECRGLGTFTFHYSDGTSQTVQCTPGSE